MKVAEKFFSCGAIMVSYKNTPMNEKGERQGVFFSVHQKPLDDLVAGQSHDNRASIFSPLPGNEFNSLWARLRKRMECIQWNSRALHYRNSWTLGETLVHTLVLTDRGRRLKGKGLHSPVQPLTVRPGSDAQSTGCGSGPPLGSRKHWVPVGPPLTVYLGQNHPTPS